MKARKKWNDANLAKKAKLKRMSDLSGAASDSDDNMIVYTGVNTPLLRTMTEVEAKPMIIGQNYKSKKILQLRIAEEANLYNIEIANNRSCDKRPYYDGRGGVVFKIQARPSQAKNWVLRIYERGGQQKINNYSKDVDSVYQEGLSDAEKNGHQDDDGSDTDNEDGDILGEQCNADDVSPTKQKRRRKNRRTPLRQHGLFPTSNPDC